MKEEDDSEEGQSCALCVLSDEDHPGLLANALYNKYTAMTEYGAFYELLCIINNRTSKMNTMYKDQLMLDNSKEYMKRYYMKTRESGKLKELLKYYRYHISLPVCHQEEVSKIIQRCQNQHLRLHYNQIKRQLNMHVQTSKSETTSQEQTETHSDVIPTCSCVLCKLNLTNEENRSKKVVIKIPNLKLLAKSQSSVLKDIVKEITSKNHQNQSYFKEDYINQHSQSRIKQDFDNYLNNIDKTKQIKLNENSQKRLFLKKNLIGVKDINDILKQSAILKPKFTFVKRKHHQHSPSQPEQNFNNFVSSPNPYNQVASGNPYRRQLKQRFKISLRHSKQKTPQKPQNIFEDKYKQYITDLPKIESNRSIRHRKLVINNRGDSSPQFDMRQGYHGRGSLQLQRQGSNQALNKVKTEMRLPRKKVMSLERMRKTLPTEIVVVRRSPPKTQKRSGSNLQAQSSKKFVLHRRQNLLSVKNPNKK